MKESELKEHEREALKVYRTHNEDAINPWGHLYQFGKEIAKKLEPELKPVDMSVLMGSGIDCVFSNFNNFRAQRIGSLTGISSDFYYCGVREKGYEYCKPRMNYWFSAENFEDVDGLMKSLAAAGFSVSKKLYGGLKTQSFMIKDLQDGFCWPWVVE